MIFKIFKSDTKTVGNIFNVGFGRPIKLKNIVRIINKKLKKGFPIYGKLKLRPDEIKVLYPDIKKTKKIFKWVPKISLLNGLKKTIK